MPVYVYRNLTTGETFELEQRITEPALTAHPETGDPVKRLIQPVGIAFKGSGFYVTDSRKARNGASAAKANGAEGKSETKPKDASDPKPASTPASKSQAKSASAGSAGGGAND